MTIVTPPSEPSILEEEAHYAIGEGPAKVVSVSVPEGTLDAFRKLVGKRGLSASLTAAMERELRDQARDAHMDQVEREHGPVTAEQRTEIDAIWARAAERESRWRADQGL